MELNPYSFVSLTAFLTDMSLAVYLLVGKAPNHPRKLLSLGLAIVSLACFADFFARNSAGVGQVVPLYRLIFAALVVVAFVVPVFLLSFLGRSLPLWSYLLPAGLSAAAALTDWFIAAGFSSSPFGPQWLFGRLAFVLFLYFLVAALYSLRVLLAVYSKLHGKLMRRKFLWLAAGITVLLLPPIIGSFAPLFGGEAPPLFPASSAIGGAIITYSFLLREGRHG